MMQLCQLPMLLLVIGWTTVTDFSGVSPNSIFTDYSLSKKVQLELLQIRVSLLGSLRSSGNSIGCLFSFAQSSNWLPWCTSLFILASLNILLHILPHTTILTILEAVRVLPISLMFQSLFSVSPLMLPLFWNSLPEDIRASPTITSFRKKLKTYLYTKDFELCILLLSWLSLESTTRWRLSTIKVKIRIRKC